MSKKRILIASAALALLPVLAWAAGAIPDMSTQIRQKGLGKEYFLGHNVPQSSSQASFVAAVAEEHAAGGGTVHVVADTPISSAVVVPSDVKVIVESGAKFLKQTGGSLTFEGPVEVTDSSAFYGFVGAGVDGGASDLIFSVRATMPQGMLIKSPTIVGNSVQELTIEGNSNEPDYEGSYFKIIAHGVNNLPDGRPLFEVKRSGGTAVWDFFHVGGGLAGAVYGSGVGSMLSVASDLSAAGTVITASTNSNHGDILQFADQATEGQTFINMPKRLTFTASGLMVFGDKVVTAPAIKASGNDYELAVRVGNDSDYGNIRLNGVTSMNNQVWSSGLYGNSAAVLIDGTAANGASAIGVIARAGNALTTEGSKIVSIQNATTEKANIDRNGQLQIGVGNTSACDTCAVGIRGQICYVGAGAGVKDTVTVCAKDAGNAYAWRTIY